MDQKPESAGEKERGLCSQEGLLVLSSSDGRVIRLRDGDVVGRTLVGKEALDMHEEISRRHAQFVRREGAWFVIDLRSSNGTFIDGKRITPDQMHPIQKGQRIGISPVFLATASIVDTAVQGAVLPPHPEEDKREEPCRKSLVILFGDLKGSVDFFQEKGTVVAQNWIVNFYHLLTSIIVAHGGEHLKNIGDAILAVFDDPHQAARAALKMQADLRRHNSKPDTTGQYHLRIGMNMGTVVLENRDVFGNVVNIASRVQALAPPEHIYITQHLYEEIKDDGQIRFRFVGDEQLKGVKGKTALYEIVGTCEKRNGVGDDGR
jgi:class 3 adenylate cyclase